MPFGIINSLSALVILCSYNFIIMWHALRHYNVLNIKRIGSIFFSKYKHEKKIDNNFGESVNMI